MASIISASTTSGTALNMSADTTGVLQLATGATPTTAVTIDASQNVGIGTTSPSYALDVQSATTTGVGTVIGSYNTASSGSSISTLRMRSAGTGASYWDINTGNTASGLNGSIRFFDNIASAERMRIDSSGNVLVGTTSNSDGVRGNFETNTNNNSIRAANSSTTGNVYCGYFQYSGQAPNNTVSQFITCADTSSTRAVIRANGGLANFSANNVNLSDERLKTDITPAKSYLDTICSIPVVTFKYNDQTDEELNLGVIAQAVNTVAPELVDHSGFGEAPKGESPYLAIYQTDLQYALMKCIQEQQTLIVSQSELINSLTARVTALEAK